MIFDYMFLFIFINLNTFIYISKNKLKLIKLLLDNAIFILIKS